MTPLYLPEFWPTDNGTIPQELMDLPWEERTPARMECFQSDTLIEYNYGKRDNRAYVSGPLSPFVRSVMDQLNSSFEGTKIATPILGIDMVSWGPLNGCFLNRYEDDHKALGWHADDFEGMDHSKCVAVVSFGEPREIWWRKLGETGIVPPEQRQLLGHGSLFIMPPGMQQTHLHRIPKGDRKMGRRISLTFRAFKETK